VASDIPGIKAKIVQERDLVASMLALIDIPFEKALLDAAQAQLDQAQRAFDKKSERWTIVNEKLQRLAVLDAQIALFTP
jgi:hypothetical protein